jgi:ParB-like chromosome segregation protein Spo0J
MKNPDNSPPIHPIRKLTVNLVPVTWLKSYEGNAKLHPPEQITRLANSISRFGFNNPVLAQMDGTVIAGHGRLLAAAKLNLETVPCIVIDDLNEEQAKAYCLADNRMSDLGTWDAAALEAELLALGETDPEMLADAGFTAAEMSDFLQSNTDAIDAGEIEFEPERPPFTCPHCGKTIGDND